jgi:protein subunit release factor A
MNPEDLKIEPHPLVRAGGQHVTTTSSAIQVIHIPTQLTVICSHERSQVKNKNFAVEMINNVLERLKNE